MAATDNVLVGYRAGTALTTGTSDVAVGSLCFISATTASDCVFVGYNAGNLCTVNQIVGIGSGALAALTTGVRNVGVGYAALGALATRDDNVAVGHSALTLSGEKCMTAVGSGALAAYTTDTFHAGACTAVGYSALAANLRPNQTAVGANALGANTTGLLNSALGSGALAANTTGSRNIALGYNACSAANGSDIVCAGYLAGTNITGSFHTIIGSGAMVSANANDNCTAVGYNCMSACAAADTTGVGANALATMSTGTHNTGIGCQALNALGTSSNCTAVGWQAGLLATGASNIFVGSASGATVTSGTNNIIVGTDAGTLTTGDHCTLVGDAANVSANNATYQTAVGAGAVCTANNQVMLGRSSDQIIAKNSGTSSAPAYSLDAAKTLGLYINGVLVNTVTNSLRSGFETANQTFNGTVDNGLFVGQNISGFGSIADNSKPSVMIGFEGDYNDGSVEQSELHFNFAGAGQSYKRPWLASYRLTAGADQYKIQQTFVADHTGGMVFTTDKIGTSAQNIYLTANAAFRLIVSNAQNMIFQTNSSDRWYIGGSSGHWIAIGNFGVQVGDGGSTTPSVTFASQTDLGFYRSSANYIKLVCSGGAGVLRGNSWELAEGDSGGVFLGSGNFIGWASGSDPDAGRDAALGRVAANVIKVSTPGGTLGWLVQVGKICLSANFTNATNTLNNTNLSIAVIAGRSYRITGSFAVGNSTAGEGIQFDFNGGSATATTFRINTVGSAGTITLGTTQSTALATALTATSATATAEVAISGFLKVNAGGTLIVRFAENSAHVSGTATLSAGSWLDLEDVTPL